MPQPAMNIRKILFWSQEKNNINNNNNNNNCRRIEITLGKDIIEFEYMELGSNID